MATERTSAPASSGSGTSFAPSTPTSPRSKLSVLRLPLGKDLGRRHSGWRQAFRRLAASLTLKLVALVGIFIALPIVLYGQFESADRQMRDLVTRAIQDRSHLIADALAPALKTIDPGRQVGPQRRPRRYSSDGTVLKLMFQPAADGDADAILLRRVGAANPRRRGRHGTRRAAPARHPAAPVATPACGMPGTRSATAGRTAPPSF